MFRNVVKIFCGNAVGIKIAMKTQSACFYACHCLLSWIACYVGPAAGHVPDIFDTLGAIERYARSTQENPKPDNNDWENPDFSSYHERQQSHLFYTFFAKLGLVKPLWDPKVVEPLLKEVVRHQEDRGRGGRFIIKTDAVPGTKFVIFGELQGAFHSFARDLLKLEKDGIIDKHLRIVKDGYFIIVNGNIESRSAYALETLVVVARLLYVNPDHVILIRGDHEDRRRWQNYALRREISLRAAPTPYTQDGLITLVNRFFDTLPLSLYVVAGTSDDTAEVVRISSYGRGPGGVVEKDFINFFARDATISVTGDRRQNAPPKFGVDVRAFVRNEEFYKIHPRVSQGLYVSGREEGAIVWTVSSSPVEANQVLFQAFYDAYAVMTTARALDDWMLTLHHRDTRLRSASWHATTYALVFGVALDVETAVLHEEKIARERVEYFQKKISAIDEGIARLHAKRDAQVHG